jgi:hypothetical protein
VGYASVVQFTFKQRDLHPRWFLPVNNGHYPKIGSHLQTPDFPGI